MYRQSRDRLVGSLPVSTPYSQSNEDEEDYYGDVEKKRESISAGWTDIGPLSRRKVHSDEKYIVGRLTHASSCSLVCCRGFSQPLSDARWSSSRLQSSYG